jgi:hypothetical protein
VLLLAKYFSNISTTIVDLATTPTTAAYIFIEKLKLNNKNHTGTGALTAMTSLFKSYCQQKANKINGLKNKCTLELLSEYEDNTFTTDHFLSSSFQEKWETGNVRTEGDGGNPTTKKQKKNVKASIATAYHLTAKPNENEDEVLPTMKANNIEDDVVHVEHH